VSFGTKGPGPDRKPLVKMNLDTPKKGLGIKAGSPYRSRGKGENGRVGIVQLGQRIPQVV